MDVSVEGAAGSAGALDASAEDARPEVAPDVAPDRAPDVVVDVTPDRPDSAEAAPPDVIVVPDSTPDAAPDVTPDAGLEASFDAAPETSDGGSTVLFSFSPGGPDLVSDWEASGDVDGGGGTLAIDTTGPGVLRWTATFPSAGSSSMIRTVPSYDPGHDWTRYTSLVFHLRVLSGGASVQTFELIVQGGVGAGDAGYTSIYDAHEAADLVNDPAFHDVTVTLTLPTVLDVAWLGLILHSVADAGTPLNTVVEIDSITLE
jgi:hypothetical protein